MNNIQDNEFKNIKNLDDSVSDSSIYQTQLLFHQPQVQKNQPKFTKNIEKLDVEYRNFFTLYLQAFAAKQGKSLYYKTLDVARQVPGIFANGFTSFYNYLTTKFQNSQISTSQSNQEGDKPKIDINTLPLFIVMPEAIANADVSTQNKWLSEQKDLDYPNVQVIAPIQKQIQQPNYDDLFKRLQKYKEDLTSSNSSVPNEDVDILPEYRQFRDPWENIKNIGESQDELLVISQNDYIEFQNILSRSVQVINEAKEQNQTQDQVSQIEQKVMEDFSEKMKKIKFYPYLAPVYNKNDFQTDKQKFELEQQENHKKEQVQLNKLENQCDQLLNQSIFVPLPEIKNIEINQQQQQKNKIIVQKEQIEYN